MACSAKSSRKAPEFAIQRMAQCGTCEHNNAGTCTLVLNMQSANSKKQATIEVGVLKPESWCPIGKWGQHKEAQVVAGGRKQCQWCRRLHDKPQAVCSWCQNKMGMELRNLKKGIGGRAFGDPYDTRLHEIRRSPFTADVKRHLHYFLYPRYAENVDYHLMRLEQARHVFNGLTAVAVAVDATTCESEFMSRINELFDLVQVFRNDVSKRELVGFVPTLKQLETNSPNDIICFAHGKGQQAHTHNTPIIRWWNDTMYETCLQNFSQAQEMMEEGYPIAGVFKSIGAFRSTAYKWHYSGSFWWARASAIFENKRWTSTCNSWWGAESYVGRHWWQSEGACLFGEHTGGGSLYDPITWVRIKKELTEWRKTHATVRYLET